MSTSSAAGRKGAECGGESGLDAGDAGVSLGKAERSGVAEPRQTERGGSNGRSEGDTEAKDAVNPMWAVM